MITLISIILVLIGAINWLLVGLFKFNLVAWICGGDLTIAARIIYGFVGAAGLWITYALVAHKGRLNATWREIQ